VTRRAQRERTVFEQGFADGQKGRPFRYNKPTKRRRGHDGIPGRYSHLYWYYTKYQAGYKLGKESRGTYWLHQPKVSKWVVKCLIGALGALLVVSFYAAL